MEPKKIELSNVEIHEYCLLNFSYLFEGRDKNIKKLHLSEFKL